MDIAHLRKNYCQAGLSKKEATPAPWELFSTWFEQALEAELPEPNAMSLATTGDTGQPNIRTVLLKAFDSSGFVFFTHYQSTKGQEIAQNPQAALLFPWVALERQIKILGKVEKISVEESTKYYQSRPRGSQLGAWVSNQSSVIASRQVLEDELKAMEQKHGANSKIALPPAWGGYRVIPHSIEFWQGRENRLHDRLRYTLQSDASWLIERLAP